MTTPTAIVTGASVGFGRAVARDLAGAGWDLVVDARTAPDLDAVATDLRAAGATVTAIAGDVADAAHRQALVGVDQQRLVHAGRLHPQRLPRLAEDELPAQGRALQHVERAEGGIPRRQGRQGAGRRGRRIAAPRCG